MTTTKVINIYEPDWKWIFDNRDSEHKSIADVVHSLVEQRNQAVTQ